MTLVDKIAQPGFDIGRLSVADKAQLVRESDGVLVDILEGEEIKGSLVLADCTSLTCLPSSLKVGWNLCLRDCSSLTSLPLGLKVGGYLNLKGCAYLTHLPEGLEVNGNLYLRGCPAEVHSGVKVKREIYR